MSLIWYVCLVWFNFELLFKQACEPMTGNLLSLVSFHFATSVFPSYVNDKLPCEIKSNDSSFIKPRCVRIPGWCSTLSTTNYSKMTKRRSSNRLCAFLKIINKNERVAKVTILSNKPIVYLLKLIR